MKRMKLVRSVVLLGAAVGMLAAFAGCEEEASMHELDTPYFQQNPNNTEPRVSKPDNAALEITPEAITVSGNGERIKFVARGGVPPYTWSVANPLAGTVQAQPAYSHAIYTVNSDRLDNNVILTDSIAHVAVALVSGR